MRWLLNPLGREERKTKESLRVTAGRQALGAGSLISRALTVFVSADVRVGVNPPGQGKFKAWQLCGSSFARIKIPRAGINSLWM